MRTRLMSAYDIVALMGETDRRELLYHIELYEECGLVQPSGILIDRIGEYQSQNNILRQLTVQDMIKKFRTAVLRFYTQKFFEMEESLKAPSKATS